MYFFSATESMISFICDKSKNPKKYTKSRGERYSQGKHNTNKRGTFNGVLSFTCGTLEIVEQIFQARSKPLFPVCARRTKTSFIQAV